MRKLTSQNDPSIFWLYLENAELFHENDIIEFTGFIEGKAKMLYYCKRTWWRKLFMKFGIIYEHLDEVKFQYINNNIEEERWKKAHDEIELFNRIILVEPEETINKAEWFIRLRHLEDNKEFITMLCQILSPSEEQELRSIFKL